MQSSLCRQVGGPQSFSCQFVPSSGLLLKLHQAMLHNSVIYGIVDGFLLEHWKSSSELTKMMPNSIIDTEFSAFHPHVACHCHRASTISLHHVSKTGNPIKK